MRSNLTGCEQFETRTTQKKPLKLEFNMGRAFEFRKERKFKRWGHMARLDHLHPGMVDQFPAAADHVEIPLVSQTDIIQNLL